MRNRTYGGVRGRKTKVGRKLLRFPPTRFMEVPVGFHLPSYGARPGFLVVRTGVKRPTLYLYLNRIKKWHSCMKFSVPLFRGKDEP